MSYRVARRALTRFGLVLLAACERREVPLAHAERQAPRAQQGGAESGGPSESGAIRIVQLEATEPPIFVLRGTPRGPHRLVFLHGMCGHGLGYAQSFQSAAARKGTLIAPQADIRCGAGPWAKWSNDLVGLDARIVSAFRKLGHSDPIDDIAVMGYSQGATRAEALARKWPDRYTRLVEMGAPQAPSPRGLSVRAAVLMAGERDRQDLMKQGARAFRAVKIPATYLMIPEASHGAMGPTPEQTMGQALDWLFDNSRPKLASDESQGKGPG